MNPTLLEAPSEHDAAASQARIATHTRPRLGFLGAGWIGRHRMMAIAEAGLADIVAVTDPSASAMNEVAASLPRVFQAPSAEALMALPLDGIVIATPSALHAAQAEAALARGIAVFCQKPLARTAAESTRVVKAAREADVLLGVDLSYRHTAAMRQIHQLVAGGALGRVYAVDLVFHNAYGPDKAWFRDPALSGGGCLIDLGTHLIDLALWTLGFPRVVSAQGSLWAHGQRLKGGALEVEDHAVASIELEGGVVVRLACSWNLHAGQDAVIGAAFHGTHAGAELRNAGGSFYDLAAERFDGTSRQRLVDPPDDWGGRAAVQWAGQLAAGARFDPGIEHIVDVAAVLDAIYGR